MIKKFEQFADSEYSKYLADDNKITNYLNRAKEKNLELYDQLISIEYDSWKDFKEKAQQEISKMYGLNSEESFEKFVEILSE